MSLPLDIQWLSMIRKSDDTPLQVQIIEVVTLCVIKIHWHMDDFFTLSDDKNVFSKFGFQQPFLLTESVKSSWLG